MRDSSREDVRNPSLYIPRYTHSIHGTSRSSRKCVEKAYRDWPQLLTRFNKLHLRRGYELPKGTKGTVQLQVALTADEFAAIEGRPLYLFEYFMYYVVYKYWFAMFCILPWLFYQLINDYNYVKIVWQLVHQDYHALTEHHHMLPALVLLSFIGTLFNGYFSKKTCTYVVLKISALAFEQIFKEVSNAEQEKTTPDAVAASPAQTKLGNDVQDSAKKMPPVKRIQYMFICKFVLAAYAMDAVELHDVDADGDAVVEELTGTAPLPPPDRLAEDAEQRDNKPNMFRMLRQRTCDAPDNELRDSVRIRVRTREELQCLRERGQKVDIPGDDSINDVYSGIQFGPGIMTVTEGMAPNAQNEDRSMHRHVKKLKHPKTKAFIPDPTPEMEARLQHAAFLMGRHMQAKAVKVLSKIAHFKPPAKWSETMKDEMPERAAQSVQPNMRGRIRNRVLGGFNKLREFMLPLLKHARAIGNLGPVANMEDAMSICPLENLMKECYPHLITKKLTLEECDLRIAKFLKQLQKQKLLPISIDFSAMDSSWTLHDRRRLRMIAEAILEPIRDYLKEELRNYDFVLDAAEKEQTIRWQLRYLEVFMSAEDAILFSGERHTSLFNRWLVLMLEFAEDLRCLGDVEGATAIKATLDGDRDVTVGDGDDNLQGIPQDRYEDQDEHIQRFADMRKILEPCNEYGELTDAEVLSRFHVLVGGEYFHISKLGRNMGRLLAFKVDIPANQEEDQVALNDKQLAMIATDIWQRTHSLKQTMVVRQFARAMMQYCLTKMRDSEQRTFYDEDMKRLGHECGDKSLRECYNDVCETLAGTEISSYAMVKVAHFKDFSTIRKPRVRQEQREWQQAERSWSEMVIDDSHITHPTKLLRDFPIPCSVCRALELSEECIAMGTELPGDPDAVLGEFANALLAADSGKLADESSPSSTGSRQDGSVDPDYERITVVIHDGNSVSGVPSGPGALERGAGTVVKRVTTVKPGVGRIQTTQACTGSTALPSEIKEASVDENRTFQCTSCSAHASISICNAWNRREHREEIKDYKEIWCTECGEEVELSGLGDPPVPSDIFVTRWGSHSLLQPLRRTDSQFVDGVGGALTRASKPVLKLAEALCVEEPSRAAIPGNGRSPGELSSSWRGTESKGTGRRGKGRNTSGQGLSRPTGLSVWLPKQQLGNPESKEYGGADQSQGKLPKVCKTPDRSRRGSSSAGALELSNGRINSTVSHTRGAENPDRRDRAVSSHHTSGCAVLPHSTASGGVPQRSEGNVVSGSEVARSTHKRTRRGGACGKRPGPAS